MTKTKEYRKQLTEDFLHVLEEKQLDWKMEWQNKVAGERLSSPMNAKTGNCYRGMNRLYLTVVAVQRGYNDNRWATFKQIQEQGWKLKEAKGQGIKVEYWYPFDTVKEKVLTWQMFQKLHQEEDASLGRRYQLRAKYATVFNGALIDGIPELPEPEQNEVHPDELIRTISKNMGVEIRNDGGNQAFYRWQEDKIHVPPIQYFNSEYAYDSTVLHELAHATGASHRLNRNIKNVFGTNEYAYEELIAEISSCFMSAVLPVEQTPEHIKNHKAYVQNWIQDIREKPETLTKAVQQAEKVACYMEYKAGLITKEEYVKNFGSSMEVSEKAIVGLDNLQEEKMRETDFLEIYQLKEEDELVPYRFMSRECLKSHRSPVLKENYQLVYTETLGKEVTLDDIFLKYNTALPEDYMGHSLSVSDIVVLHRDSKGTAYYVDDIGFSEVPPIVWEKEYLENKQEIALQIGDGFLQVQVTDGGYDYTFYDSNYISLNGGVYDSPKLSLREAVIMILADENRILDECVEVGYENLMEHVEEANRIMPRKPEQIQQMMTHKKEAIPKF